MGVPLELSKVAWSPYGGRLGLLAAALCSRYELRPSVHNLTAASSLTRGYGYHVLWVYLPHVCWRAAIEARAHCALLKARRPKGSRSEGAYGFVTATKLNVLRMQTRTRCSQSPEARGCA